MVFHWSLSASKSPQVSRTFLSILFNLNNVVVWMVSIHPLILNSFSPLSKTFGTVLKASITIGITVTLFFHSFLSCLFFTFLNFILKFAGTAKSTVRQILFFFFFFFFKSSLCLVFWSGLDDPFVSQNPKEFRVSHSPERILILLVSVLSMVLSIFQEGLFRCLFDEISATELGFEQFSRLFQVLFSYFFLSSPIV